MTKDETIKKLQEQLDEASRTIFDQSVLIKRLQGIINRENPIGPL